jgi:lipoprotein-releasing system ATP-binding protein
MGGLDTPDQGSVVFDGRDISDLSGVQRDHFRNHHVGFVFQFYHLLPELSALENVLIAAMIGRGYLARRTELRGRAEQLLEQFGLHHRRKHRPMQLSGGERQRVAIARALVNRPRVLLADEPTGNLDGETGRNILQVLQDLHRAGQTLVMVTHDTAVAKRADRVLTLESGRLK